MKKITLKFIAFLVCGVMTVTFVSCEKEHNVPTQQEVETKIIGKWKITIDDGKDCLTNNRSVKTYMTNGVEYVSRSQYSKSKGGWSWKVDELYDYSIKNNIVSENSIQGKVQFVITVKSISDNTLVYSKENTTEGYKGNPFSTGVLSKVNVDYSQNIIGLWEGVEMTGDETYGNVNARIDYHADGSYTYYKKQGEEWIPNKITDNEYNVDGDWLATRWRPAEDADYNYEWWDIQSITTEEMKWTALREKEDGTRFTATFTWKKVK